MRPVSLLACLTLGLGACNPWYDDDKYAFAVFSDDGQGIAAVYLNFEAQRAFSHTRTRNYQTQVLMQEDLSTSTPPAITPMLPGHAQDLFFMREQGYLVLGRWGDANEVEDGSEERVIWYDHITMDGTITSLGGGEPYITMLSCDGGTSSSSTARPLRVIPSPDGAVLAKFEATSTCDGREMSLTFLDAQDLSVIEGPLDVPGVAPEMFGGEPWWGNFELAWISNDEFALGFWGMSTGMGFMDSTVVTVDGEISEGVEVSNDCFYPPTSSSSSSLDSEQYVQIDMEFGDLYFGEDPQGVSACDR